ncbi:MAG: TIGR00730 family Rossman fold protein [Prevotella sp.]|nr:TIGR00730 family Rossman fold protein [Prevotella sp.]
MRICVFCSANETIDPSFFELTRQLGRWIGENGHTLVYGGCDLGLMECVAQAVSEADGQVTGVIPIRLERGGHVSDYVHNRILCETLSERKDLMLTYSDVAVALPGGLGTLDEVFSMAAEGTLGYHGKRVVVYNMGGFWNGLRALLDQLEERGLMRGDYRRLITFADTWEEVVTALEATAAHP